MQHYLKVKLRVVVYNHCSTMSFIFKYYCQQSIDNLKFSDLFDLSILAGREYSFCVDANRIGNFARFFNHICEPNMIPIRVLRYVKT